MKKKKGDGNSADGVDNDSDAEARALFLASLEKLDLQAIAQRKEHDTRYEEKHRPLPSKSEQPRQLDLHGMILADAKSAVDQFLATVTAQARGVVKVRIITGKGRHSGPGGAVLAREIHDYVRRKYSHQIQKIDEAPLDAQIGGLPIRGHFDVLLKTK